MQPDSRSGSRATSAAGVTSSKDTRDAFAKLDERMKSIDWSSDFSDDASVRARGGKQIAMIQRDLGKLAKSNLQAARSLWDRHAPKDMPKPKFLNGPELSTSEGKAVSSSLPVTGKSSSQDVEPGAAGSQEVAGQATVVDRAPGGATRSPDPLLDLAKRMRSADWAFYNDAPGATVRGTAALKSIDKDLRELASNDLPATQQLWTLHAPKAIGKPEYLFGSEPHAAREAMDSRGPSSARESIAVPEATAPTQASASKTPTIDIDPERQAALADKRAVETSAAARAMGMNFDMNLVEPARGQERRLDSPEQALDRAVAKEALEPRDAAREAKAIAIDAMTAAELAALANAGKDIKKAEQVYQGVANRVERAQADTSPRKSMPPLEERFNVRRHLLSKDYEFRDQPGKVAFTERLTGLRSHSHAPAAAIGMLDRAAERGWGTVRISGSEEFKRQAWIAADARGINAIGHTPTKGDIEAANAERGRLAAGQARHALDRNMQPAQQAHASQAQPARPQAEGQAKPQAQGQERKGPEQPEQAQTQTQTQRANERDGRSFVAAIVGSAEVMRALDLALDKQGVPADKRSAVREAVGEKLIAMQATGQSARVRLYDQQAPRVQTPTVPQHEHRRTTQERSR